MTLHEAFERMERQRRFERLARAHEAACRRKAFISAALFQERMADLGAYLDAAGVWRLGDAPDGAPPTGRREDEELPS